MSLRIVTGRGGFPDDPRDDVAKIMYGTVHKYIGERSHFTVPDDRRTVTVKNITGDTIVEVSSSREWSVETTKPDAPALDDILKAGKSFRVPHFGTAVFRR